MQNGVARMERARVGDPGRRISGKVYAQRKVRAKQGDPGPAQKWPCLGPCAQRKRGRSPTRLRAPGERDEPLKRGGSA